MANPALNEKIFQRETPEGRMPDAAGWAAAQESYAKPAYRGPVTGDDTMTLNGTIWAAAALIVLVIAGGAFGWSQTTSNETTIEMPPWLWLTMIGGLGVAILTIFKPPLARFTGPLYALLMGTAVGAISKVYEGQMDGIVLQAVGLTVGVFMMMLFLYATRIIRVTEKLRMGIVAACGAIFLVYMADIVLSLFGADVPFLHEATPMGIGISLVIVGVAAFSLLLDFDLIERGVEAGAPKYMEWYGAFGLVVTLIWLYLELLRLLGKIQRN